MTSLLSIKRLFFLFFIILLFCSCAATDMTTRASRVRIVNVEQVQLCESQCKFLGNVKGRSFSGAGLISWSSIGRSIAYNNALDKLLDNAAEIGATHVFIDFGDYHVLRGEAYQCYICMDKNGMPDTAKCMDINGKSDEDICIDKNGKPFEAAHCEGAKADNLLECRLRGGKWIPGITEEKCKNMGYKWIPRAKNRIDCERKGKIWVPVARDKESCEAKGGKWVPNRNLLKIEFSTEK